MKPLNIVGSRVIRVDGKAKVKGQAIYPQDIYLDGMLYGKTIRSTKVHAMIEVDTKKAEKLEGVVKILTHKDVTGENHHGVVFKDHEVFCSTKVRRIGDPIAFVIANSERVAKKASEMIEIKYKELPAIFDPIEAMKEDSIKIHGESNIIYHYKCRKGNVNEGFEKSHVIVEREYKTSMVEHAFLQPEAGVSYIDKEGKICVCASTQYPHFDQIEVAEANNGLYLFH